MKIDLPVSNEILTAIGRLDRFQGSWNGNPPVARDRLERIEEACRVQSVAASARLAGIRVTDAEVADLLRGDDPTVRDARDIRGYAAGLAWPLPGSETLLTGDHLRELNAVILGGENGPSPWRTQPLYRETFDADGRATGHVFSTIPARLVPEKTEELLTWLELELRTGEQHPVLVVAAFMLCLLVASPFERGSGRLARLLATRLLTRAGYTYLPFASFESILEARRDEMIPVFALSQQRIWTSSFDPAPWVGFVVGLLDEHRGRVEKKVELERDVTDYPPLQQQILETVREHGTVDAALLLQATGANRNTLKDNLRRLVQRGVLERSGQRRGTRYRMATAAPAADA